MQGDLMKTKRDFLKTPIEYLKNVGPERAKQIKSELQVSNFGELLNHIPFRYVDKSKFYKTTDLGRFGDQALQLKGRINSIKEVSSGKAKRLTALFSDDHGSIELIWFSGIKWIKPILMEASNFIIYGKPNRFKGKWSIAHPELEKVGAQSSQKANLQPVYSSTEKLGSRGLHSKGIHKLMLNLLQHPEFSIPEILPSALSSKMGFFSRKQCYVHLHAPKTLEQLQKARFQLKFEELFIVQLQILKLKLKKTKNRGHVFSEVGDQFNTFYHDFLKFQLTNAQKKVIKEIRKDLGTGLQMNRLLQGDVGSGKTIVSLLISLIALDNGFQVALLAPTEILAQQHYASYSEQLQKLGISCALLTGSTKKSERKKILPQLEEGTLKILIGTHAILEDSVQFQNLGLVVIDEQHRFGVAQRAKLWNKGKEKYPHILVMTATPIPRTLAMTFYGDLDISVINELPPGRKDIKTIHLYENSRLKMLGFVRQEIDKGRQVYIVYPLIEESEKLDYKDLMDGYEGLIRHFPQEKYPLGVLHGRMKPSDKEFEMQRFVKGETKILVCTTVVEVGVNVPNASVMVIENAERFGLSQLHQLRGRVGRGQEQSYCILMTSHKLTSEGKERIATMVRSNDGFVIAEADLKLRGPGDLMGTQQSGLLNFRIADLVKDEKILAMARHAANELLNSDPNLENAEHKNLNLYLSQSQKIAGWGQIS
ncbi:MAG: ATP-dependent DNA helicase RecG [Flavobacteriales bacterium]|nr:ATP-dependent DNA helicase RecG [Flavobacteriales bacterium]